MKTMNLRDANQQFSRLVREIEETGEPVLVLRNGKPAIRLSAVGAHEKPEEAGQHLADSGRTFTYPDAWERNRASVRTDNPSRPTRQVNERDVNQQLIEQVEQTGEAVEILRDGKPTAEIRPAQHAAPCVS